MTDHKKEWTRPRLSVLGDVEALTLEKERTWRQRRLHAREPGHQWLIATAQGLLRRCRGSRKPGALYGVSVDCA